MGGMYCGGVGPRSVLAGATLVGPLRSSTRSWCRKSPIESAGRCSDRLRRYGGNNNAAQRAARISSTTMAKLLDLPLLSGTVRDRCLAAVDASAGASRRDEDARG